MQPAVSLRRAASLALGLVAVLALLCFIFWPEWAEQTLHSRGALAIFTGWCAIVTALVNPEFNNSISQSIRSFQQTEDDDIS
jgi:hypothetical protein